MGRSRKRKRRSLEKGARDGESPTKRAKTYNGDNRLLSSRPHTRQCAVLDQFYAYVVTLRTYVISELPSSSRIRRKKVASVGTVPKSPDLPISDEENSLGTLLDTTLIGVIEASKQHGDGRLDAWRNSSQRGDESYVTLSNGIPGYAESQNLIIEYAIRTLFSRDKSTLWPKHLLCDGYRRDGSVSVRRVRLNPNVELLKQSPWPQLLALLGESGERVMMSLLLDCAIFVSVKSGANNLCQVSGKPLSEIETHRSKNPDDSKLAEDHKTSSELVFVRNRMLYARAALNARGSVQFGLRHIHVLNRSLYVHLDGSEISSAEETKQFTCQNNAHTLRVLMYIFPRQFGLHNVFTSKVNLKETSQRLKDYTLREEEIALKFGRLNDPDTRVNKPKRLRGQVTDLVRKLQIFHKRCSYSKILRHYCPIPGEDSDKSPRPSLGKLQLSASPRKQEMLEGTRARKLLRKSRMRHSITPPQLQSLSQVLRKSKASCITDLATAPFQVSACIQAVLKKVVPRGFWGSGTIANHNEELFLRSVHRFISLRRFESMSLHDLAQGMKITDIGWLAPAHLLSNRASKTDLQKRRELFDEFLYFLVDSLVIPLVRSNFYVTESNTDKYRLFFFRHDIWRSLVEPTIAGLKGKMFEEVNIVDAQKILSSRLLGFSQVRLLPKGIAMRPIMNLRKRAAIRGNSKELGPGINKILGPMHSVLQLEKSIHPERLGSTLFSVGDIYRCIKSFKTHLGKISGKLYFAKVDVQSAFDTIPQSAIVGLINSIPQQRSYYVSKYLEVVSNLDYQKGNRTSKSKVLKKWPSAAMSNLDSSTFLQSLESEKATAKRNTVFVDLWKKRHESSELLELVASHIQQNLVKIGKKFFRQKEGIPQGSVLSSTLCNYFYADLEMHVLPFLKDSESGHCMLLRLIDDFLLITTERDKAVRFVEVMHQGVPEYGVTVNPRKSLVNFDLTINGQDVPKLGPDMEFPYCGTILNCKTLDIARCRGRENKTAIYNSLTVEFSRTPGRIFERKVLNAFKIQSHLMFFDTGLNSAKTMLKNIYDAFSETATKMWAYSRCLPTPKQPPAGMVIRTISKLIEMAYLLLTSKSRKLRYPGYVCDVKKCEVSWLAYNAFNKVLTAKQSKYMEVIPWLRTEMWKVWVTKDIRCGRVRSVVSSPRPPNTNV